LQKRKYGKSYSVGMYMGQSAPGAFNWMLYMRRSAPKVLVFTNNVARKSTFLTDNWRKSDLQQLEQAGLSSCSDLIWTQIYFPVKLVSLPYQLSKKY